MINIRKAKATDYDRLMAIWSSAVLATHDFLNQADFELFATLIPTEFFPQLDVYLLERNDDIVAFFAVSDDNLEMLFVDAACHGQGLGKIAVNYVLQRLRVHKVDVNEQNPKAIQFYLRMGYTQKGRSERDGMGKPYPLLHLEYDPELAALDSE